MIQVKRDFMCLYCSELCHAFSSLEAVRKHMEAKSHCKLHYGDFEEDALLHVSFYKKKCHFLLHFLKTNLNLHFFYHEYFLKVNLLFATFEIH